VRKRLTERQGPEESIALGGGFGVTVPGHRLCEELGTPSGVAATGPCSWAVLRLELAQIVGMGNCCEGDQGILETFCCWFSILHHSPGG